MRETNDAFDLVKIYLDRKKLSELGITMGADMMNALDAESLLTVSDAFVREEMAKMKREAKNGKRP